MRLANSGKIERTPSLAIGVEGIGRVVTPPPLEKWITLAVMGGIVASLVSIAASSILLGAALLMWTPGALRNRRLGLALPPFKWVLGAFLGAVLLSILFSLDPLYSLRYLTKTVKIGLLIFAWTYLTRRQVESVFKAVLAVLACSAVYGLLQYEWLLDINLLNRIRGFMSHWMTFSGQLMLGAVSLSAYLILGRQKGGDGDPRESRRRAGETVLWVGVLSILLLALLLTFTRNAWLGTLVGLVTLSIMINRRWFFVGLMALGLIAVTVPGQFKERLLDGFDLHDTTTQSRLELLHTGAGIIADHPWTGVGPRMVPIVAQRYRTNHQFPDWLYQHLHNSPLQIAAEMGIIGLAAWLALWGWLIRDFWRMSKGWRERDPFRFFVCVNALCVSAAFLSAGLLEYNFGDSELLYLMIFFVIAPYVVARETQTDA